MGIVLLILAVSGIAAFARGRGASPWLLGSIAIAGYLGTGALARSVAGPESIVPVFAPWGFIGLVALWTRFLVGRRSAQPEGRWVCPDCRWLNAHYSIVCEACGKRFDALDDNERTEEKPSSSEANPYHPPESKSAESGIPVTSSYRPASRMVLWLSVLLILEAGLELVFAFASTTIAWNFSHLLEGEPPASPLETLVALMHFGTAVLLLLVSISGLALFLAWLYRANDNAWELGAEDLQFTPGASVIWFFIPFFNLYKPYQALAELYRASFPEAEADEWALVPVPRWLTLWWILWVGSYVIGLLARGADSALPIGTLFGAAAALATVMVVRRINRNQESKYQIQKTR